MTISEIKQYICGIKLLTKEELDKRKGADCGGQNWNEPAWAVFALEGNLTVETDSAVSGLVDKPARFFGPNVNGAVLDKVPLDQSWGILTLSGSGMEVVTGMLVAPDVVGWKVLVCSYFSGILLLGGRELDPNFGILGLDVISLLPVVMDELLAWGMDEVVALLSDPDKHVK